MEYTEHQQSLLRKLEQLQKDEGLSLSALPVWASPREHSPSCFPAAIRQIRRRCLRNWKAISG